MKKDSFVYAMSNGPGAKVYTTIDHDGSENVCLTDMWKAVKAAQAKRPSKWRETLEYKNFIGELKKQLPANKVLISCRDKKTWANWQIAMAYAKYLSPAFHIWCNRVIKKYMEDHSSPTIDEKPHVQMGHTTDYTMSHLTVLDIVKSHARSLVEAGLPKATALNVVTEVVNRLCNVSFPMLMVNVEVTPKGNNLFQLPVTNGAVYTHKAEEDKAAQVIPIEDTTDYMHVSTWVKRDVTAHSSKEMLDNNLELAASLKSLGLKTTDVTSALRAIRIHPGKTSTYEPTELELKEIFEKYAKRATGPVSVLINNVPTDIDTHGGYLFNHSAISKALAHIKVASLQLGAKKK